MLRLFELFLYPLYVILDPYVVQTNLYCKKVDYYIDGNLTNAKKNCTDSSSCQAFYDGNGNGNGFNVCADNLHVVDSTNNDILYRKSNLNTHLSIVIT